MRDPYTILGLNKSASNAEIKKAFRDLAKKYHPDQNKDNPKAQDRFAEINTAYEIVGDKDKRGPYDRGEIDAQGKPKYQGFEGFGGRPGGRHAYTHATAGGEGFEEVLKDIFGGFGAAGGPAGRRPGRQQVPPGADIATNATVTLEQIVNPGTVRITLAGGKSVDVKLPLGLEHNQQFRLKGQGLPSQYGGAAGDALITVRVAPHKLFRPEGDDLRLDLPISLDEAVLGARVRVPTLEGTVALRVPENSNSGRVMRLKGKGLPTKNDSRGDILATLRITLPDAPDADLIALMKAWRARDARDE